jgi:hypothetical protein
VKIPAVFWCGSEDISTLFGGSGSGLGMVRLGKPTSNECVTNYWYRCSTGVRYGTPTSWPGLQSIRINKIHPPDNGLIMCGGWSGGGNEGPNYMRWTMLHQYTGINVAYIDGHIEWSSFKKFHDFPQTSIGQNFQTGSPSDTGKNRYRADMAQATINRATECLAGSWKYP